MDTGHKVHLHVQFPGFPQDDLKMGKPLRAAPTVSVLILAGKLHCADSSPVYILQLTNQFPVIQLRTG